MPAQIFETLLTSQRASGVTLASGKVYFWYPGTTNAKPIYANRGMTTVAANPYTLSANGTAMLYGSGLYDVALYTAANVQVTLWEDVSLIDMMSDSEARPEWYGAVGDGVTDDTTAIQAAVDTGLTVVLSPRTYKISSSIILPTNAVFKGSGRDQTIISMDADMTDFAIKVEGASSAIKQRGYIGDFTIAGNESATALGGIKIDWCYIWTVERVNVKEIFNTNAVGFYCGESFNINYMSCQGNLGTSAGGETLGTPYGTGFHVYSDGVAATAQNVTQISFYDCLAQYNETGLLLETGNAGDGIVIKDSAFGKSTVGIYMKEAYLSGVDISQNHFEYNTVAIKGEGSLIGVDIRANYFWETVTGIQLIGTSRTVKNIIIAANSWNGRGAPNFSTGTAVSLTDVVASTTDATVGVLWDMTNTIASTAYSTGISNTNSTVVYGNKSLTQRVLSNNFSSPVTLTYLTDHYSCQNTAYTSMGAAGLATCAPGQTITISFDDNYSRIFKSTYIFLNGGGDVYGLGSKLILYTPDGTHFYEVGRYMPLEAYAPDHASSVYKGFTHTVGDFRWNSTVSGILGWRCVTTSTVAAIGTTPSSGSVWEPVTTATPQSGTAAANTITPRYVGDEYFKTDSSVWYKAKGVTTSDWIALN